MLNYIEELINDEYGNFIIQQIVFMKNIEYNIIINDFICKNLFNLARQKFSSNVIDKVYYFDLLNLIFSAFFLKMMKITIL